ncbi:MAG TPA: flagellar motor switch protein FliN [Baekduia sp.]|uniref:flagellar motor switch protein FliN n=1 Tax=Baekduia sp. TaxID=2600305 RepID=UPI002CC71A4D|nr:flagellar motor switch protein FliN [Baekduia sp.]HMJ33117.1 flagellar motor switch protein FliN [Baekduia sp.]
MNDVEFTHLPDDAGAGAGHVPDADLTRLTAVTVELTVEVGRTHMSLGETMSLGQGSVVTLDRLADKPVDLLVNGRPIARGEVVVIDEQFGLRITEVMGAERSTAAAPVAFTPEAIPGDPAALDHAA